MWDHIEILSVPTNPGQNTNFNNFRKIFNVRETASTVASRVPYELWMKFWFFLDSRPRWMYSMTTEAHGQIWQCWHLTTEGHDFCDNIVYWQLRVTISVPSLSIDNIVTVCIGPVDASKAEKALKQPIMSSKHLLWPSGLGLELLKIWT